MKTKFQKILSVICIFTLLLTSVSSFAIAETADDVSIITAQFLPYEQEIRVLASVPTGYTGKLLVNGTEVTSEVSTWGDNTLYTVSYTPTAYGIVPVTLQATKGETTLADTKKVKLVKAFHKLESVSEDFSLFSSQSMTSGEDSTVASAISNSGDGEIKISNIPHTNKKAFLSIENNYMSNTGICSLITLQGRHASGLPQLAVNPKEDEIIGGIVEFSYDMYPSSRYIRTAIGGKNAINGSAGNNILFNGLSTFPVIHNETHAFGNTNIIPKAQWYNIRFVINMNELTFSFYVDNELFEQGDISYQNGIPAIYAINNLYMNFGNTDGGTYSIAIDNIKMRHIFTGATPSDLSYTLDSITTDVNLLNAEIPHTVEAINAQLSDSIVYEAGDITLQTENGMIVDAQISVASSDEYGRQIIAVNPALLLPAQNYKIVIDDCVVTELHDYDDAAYGNNVEIPFSTIPYLMMVSPIENTNVKQGEIITVKACTPGASYVDMYINNEYVTTLYPNENDYVTYSYDTTSQALGEKNIKLVVTKNDGTSNILATDVTISKTLESDITPLDTFDNFISETEYKTTYAYTNTSINSITRQSNVTERVKPIRESILTHDNALSVYYMPNKLATAKTLFIQDTLDNSYSGRLVFEHDLYITDEMGTLNYAFEGYKDTTKTTFYALGSTTLLKNNIIGGQNAEYADKWSKIKIILDTVRGCSEVYLDGNLIKSDNSLDADSINYLRITYSCGVKSAVDTEVFAFAIDNWRVYKEYPLPAISSVTSYDANANSAAISEGDLISNSVNGFKLDLSNAIYADSTSLVNNITLSSNGVAISKENADLSNGVLTFNVSNLPENADLTLTIEANTALYDGTTVGADTVFNFKVADANGLYAKKTITTDANNAKAIYKLDAITEKTLNLIIATYNGDELVDVIVKPVTFDNAQNISLTLPKAGTNKAKAFIWGADGITPVSAGN